MIFTFIANKVSKFKFTLYFYFICLYIAPCVIFYLVNLILKIHLHEAFWGLTLIFGAVALNVSYHMYNVILLSSYCIFKKYNIYLHNFRSEKTIEYSSIRSVTISTTHYLLFTKPITMHFNLNIQLENRWLKLAIIPPWPVYEDEWIQVVVKKFKSNGITVVLDQKSEFYSF
jgi:hypothetical protein